MFTVMATKNYPKGFFFLEAVVINYVYGAGFAIFFSFKLYKN